MRLCSLPALLFLFAILATPALAQEEGVGEHMQAEGSISSIDEQNMTMQVQPVEPGAAPMTLSFSDQTKVMGPEGALDWSALIEGDRIRASYQLKDGQNMASEIEVLAPAGGEAAGAGEGM